MTVGEGERGVAFRVRDVAQHLQLGDPFGVLVSVHRIELLLECELGMQQLLSAAAGATRTHAPQEATGQLLLAAAGCADEAATRRRPAVKRHLLAGRERWTTAAGRMDTQIVVVVVIIAVVPIITVVSVIADLERIRAQIGAIGVVEQVQQPDGPGAGGGAGAALRTGGGREQLARQRAHRLGPIVGDLALVEQLEKAHRTAGRHAVRLVTRRRAVILETERRRRIGAGAVACAARCALTADVLL
mmetsp:Transcript_12988/g.39270  ORF Transcript_12988/g.39270 Transcript_12988/m.39270 type:complete len:245 (-) Transcript_12988:532-1266(-)